MVLIPQETLTKLQSARRLEQTPTTRVVHGLDAEIRELLDRQNLSDEDKVKLYHQTLHRFINLNKQRMAPLSMTLETKKDDNQPVNPEAMSSPPKLEREPSFHDSPTLKLHSKGEPEEEEASYHLPQLFAEAPHLKPTPKGTKRKADTRKRGPKPKWTTY